MFLNWAIPEKIQTGGVKTLFWKRTYFFGHFTLGDSRQDEVLPLEIPHYFFLDHAWKFHFFFYWLLEFPDSIFSIPLEIPCPQLPPPPPPLPLIFSGIAIEVVTASQTKICKLFWTRVYALDNEPKPYCLTFVLVFCQPWQPCNNESLKYIMQFTAKDGWQTMLLVVKTCIIDWSTWYLHQEFGVTGQYWCRSLSVSLLGPHDHVKIYFPEAFCTFFSLTIFDWMATP